MICKICDSEKISIIGVKDGKIVYRCEDCSFLFIDDDRLNDNNLIGGESELERNAPQFNEMRLRRLNNPKRLLDFGCGHGIFVDFCRQRGIDAIGIDLDTELRLEDLTKEHIFDAITMVEVIEHLYDPFSVLNKLKTHLSENGIIYIESSFTDTEKIYGNRDISKNPDELLNWWYLSPRQGHISFFNQKSMEILVKKLGLRLMEPRYNANVFRICKKDRSISLDSRLHYVKYYIARFLGFPKGIY